MENKLNFLNALDWVYIFTLILITYLLEYYKVSEWIGNGLFKIRTRFQVLIIGFVYAVIVFLIRGYDLPKIECLFMSFLFATAFHKFLLQVFIEKFFPKKKAETSKEDPLKRV